MLHLTIVASKAGDIEIRPLNARSLALSALLGTHPPSLPGNRLVALAELFDVAGGTMRTALSRMVAAGDLALDDGRYRLVGRLLERQRTQDIGRRPPTSVWDGRWYSAVAIDDRRALDARRRDRQVLADHRFAELRPDIWMRPANLPAPQLGRSWAVVTGPTDRDDHDLVIRLWRLDTLAATASTLRASLADAAAPLGTEDPSAIPAAFHAAAAVVRFLRTEPMLPDTLLPRGWPVDRLRAEYDLVEAALQHRLRSFYTGA